MATPEEQRDRTEDPPVERVERGPGHDDAPQLHEPSDVSIRGILWFTAGLVVSIGLVTVLLAWLFTGFANRENRLKASLFPLREAERERGRRLPPAPRLENLEPRRSLKLEEGQGTNPPQIDPESFGWTDHKREQARIPVSQALDRARRLGLLRSSADRLLETTSSPSDANSGRQSLRGSR